MPASVRWVAVGVAWVAMAGLAHAARPTTQALLERAALQVDEADYEQALVTLQDALTAPDVSNDAVALIHWRRAEVYVYLNRPTSADEAFERLLYVRPDWQPPALTPPHVKAAFARAAAAFAEGPGRLALTVPEQSTPSAGRPFPFGARVRHLPGDFSVHVFFRQAASEAWQSAALVPGIYGEDAFFTATLPAFPAGSTVEYYVEIQDARLRRVVGDASALAPRTLKVAGAPAFTAPVVEPDEDRPSRWWVWVAVGGAVVAAGVISYLALSDDPARLELRVKVTP